MTRKEVLEILGAEEGYYTEEYLNDVPKQIEIVRKVTEALSPNEVRLLTEMLNVCKNEFWAILEYLGIDC